MIKGFFGTIAALAAGAGIAVGQSPFVPPPTPISPAMNYGEVQPAEFNVPQQVIPPQFGQGGPGGPGGPGGMMDGPPGLTGPNGMPSYPPPGQYGAQSYESAINPNRSSPSGVSHYYLTFDYLLWSVSAQPSNVPYVTTSAPSDRGLAGRSTTALLYSNTDLGYGLSSGFRVTGGWFKGEDRRYGYEISGFSLEQKSNSFYAQSANNGVPVLARPFIDATNNSPAVLTISQPNLANGNVLVATSNRIFGAEVSGIVNMYRGCPTDGARFTANGLLGFRFMEIDEKLEISSASTLLGGGAPLFNGLPVFAPGTITVQDGFHAVNRFYGGQAGFQTELRYSRYTFGFTGKVAIGLMNQTLDITGQSALLDPTRGLAQVALGGVYANSMNIGRYRNDEFAVVPEFSGTFGYNWTSWLTTSVGYNFLYANRVLRPGNSFSDRVNPAVLPTSQNFGTGSVVPIVNRALTQDELFAQGVTFSLLMKY